MKFFERRLAWLPLMFVYAPFAILVPMVGEFSFSAEGRFGSVLGLTSLQSFLSAVLSLTLGFLGALGLVRLELISTRVSGRWLDSFALLPNFAPPVFLIVAALTHLGTGVRGLWGIVLLHTLMNVGVVSVFLKHAIRAKASRWAGLAAVEGASRRSFLVKGVLRGLRRELFYAFLFVFALSFTSFSVPLALGGAASGASFEIYIYELLRIDGNWSGALGAALFQSVILVILFLYLPLLNRGGGKERAYSLDFTLPGCWMIPLVPPLFMIFSLVHAVRWLPDLMGLFSGVWSVLSSAFLGSLLLGLGVGWLTLILLLWIARYPLSGLSRRLFLGTVSPSASLVGMAVLFLAPSMENSWDFVRMIVGLTLLFLPALYRLELDGCLKSLQSQRRVAALMGAPGNLTFKEIVLPQVLPSCARLAGVASLWAWGEFAFTNLVSSERKTLAALILSLMESYRFEVASLLLAMVLVGGSACFLFFYWVGNVYSKKSYSS